MKAITIIQPWATLIALGEKRFETRSWSTKHRGPLAIHAGKKIDKEACEVPEIKEALARHGYTGNNLPTGAVIATTNLERVYPINHHAEHLNLASSINEQGDIEEIFENNEYAFGWYEEGLFAWKLDTLRRLTGPIPAKGQQGLWNWEGVQP
ncbi:2-oxoglutarate dehydrogenase E1 [Paenibacillus sp. VTT E-133280]|uniref:ASCH domain-containing protein n=1 Tax=Paenibacillus sp. VTT E-133280 TaxID=1986222 RepID=UPI000B9FE23A|nr:ASCH domain-containing protein [Paenibacillus sp. VTT E-133280]OZQ66094.1 2-oxoglutarate dehydrogenase E1 [Paenibacillus sp. VTT E-133280]